jgi:hypothetical protein
LFGCVPTFSLRTSWMWEASLEMLFMISDVVASCESKKPASCRRMACRYRYRIRSTCRSLVRLQQYPSAIFSFPSKQADRCVRCTTTVVHFSVWLKQFMTFINNSTYGRHISYLVLNRSICSALERCISSFRFSSYTHACMDKQATE